MRKSWNDSKLEQAITRLTSGKRSTRLTSDTRNFKRKTYMSLALLRAQRPRGSILTETWLTRLVREMIVWCIEILAFSLLNKETKLTKTTIPIPLTTSTQKQLFQIDLIAGAQPTPQTTTHVAISRLLLAVVALARFYRTARWASKVKTTCAKQMPLVLREKLFTAAVSTLATEFSTRLRYLCTLTTFSSQHSTWTPQSPCW